MWKIRHPQCGDFKHGQEPTQEPFKPEFSALFIRALLSRNKWGTQQGARGNEGTCYLLTVFKTSQLRSVLQRNLVSETSALLCEMTFLIWSQPEKSPRLSVQLQPKEWSGKGGKKKKKTITAWQLFLTLCGMDWWDKANWNRVKHFAGLFLFFFLTDSSWQRPRAEKSAVPELPLKMGPPVTKGFEMCLPPGPSPSAIPPPDTPHTYRIDTSDC